MADTSELLRKMIAREIMLAMQFQEFGHWEKAPDDDELLFSTTGAECDAFESSANRAAESILALPGLQAEAPTISSAHVHCPACGQHIHFKFDAPIRQAEAQAHAVTDALNQLRIDLQARAKEEFSRGHMNAGHNFSSQALGVISAIALLPTTTAPAPVEALAQKFHDLTDRLLSSPKAVEAPRYANVGCSQCGGTFGPGDNGFSYCSNHKGLAPTQEGRG